MAWVKDEKFSGLVSVLSLPVISHEPCNPTLHADSTSMNITVHILKFPSLASDEVSHAPCSTGN